MPQLTDEAGSNARTAPATDRVDGEADDGRGRAGRDRPGDVRPARAGAGGRMTPRTYGASRAAVWTAAVVLVTDTDGRVLVQSVDYRADRLLPGGAVDAGEAPSAAAARELREELGVDGHYPRGLAVDWIPADTPGIPPEMRFPGEILHVYDGGTWTPDRIDAVRLPAQEITGIDFAEPADLPALMDAGDARRALSALRARINGDRHRAAGGRPPHRADRPRPARRAPQPPHPAARRLAPRPGPGAPARPGPVGLALRPRRPGPAPDRPRHGHRPPDTITGSNCESRPQSSRTLRSWFSGTTPPCDGDLG